MGWSIKTLVGLHYSGRSWEAVAVGIPHDGRDCRRGGTAVVALSGSCVQKLTMINVVTLYRISGFTHTGGQQL